jgi:hypothetical protein
MEDMMDESEAAASSADFLLAAEEITAAIRHLHARGGLNDVFDRLRDKSDEAGEREP